MSRLESAIREMIDWIGRVDDPVLPEAAPALLDIVSTGLADLGVALPMPGTALDASWIATFFAALARAARIEEPAFAGARTRVMARLAREHSAYHCAAVAGVCGAAGIAPGWDGPARAALRTSFGEVVVHLAQGFARHGRVPHCGAAGRALLHGPALHEGDTPFVPARPPYRYAGNLTAEVQLNFGLPIFVDTADESVAPDIIRTGWWEPWIDGLVRRCVGPGDVAVNVGANFGYHALLMARSVEATGQVYAFEPNPRLVELLRCSLTWGGLQAMTHLLPFAASDAPGAMKFTSSRLEMGGGGFFRAARMPNEDHDDLTLRVLKGRYRGLDDADLRAMGNALRMKSDVFDVHATTLDATVGRLVDAIHFLLIDAEGAEPRVLLGAKDLITRSRDLAMVVEWSNGVTYAITPEERQRARATIEWLAGEDFRFWKIGGDPRDTYALPAVLDPLSPEEVIGMEGYADLYVSRQAPQTP